MIAAIRALVAATLLPRVRAALDGEPSLYKPELLAQAEEDALPLSAQIADRVRDLGDDELLALVGPGLLAKVRSELGAGFDARPFPSPARRERLLRRRQVLRGLRRVRRWIWESQARSVVEGNRIPWRPGFTATSATIMIRPLPAPPVALEDLGPLEDEPAEYEEETPTDAPGMSVFIAAQTADDRCVTTALPLAATETTRDDVAPPASLRKLPVLSPEVAPTIVLRAPTPPAPALLWAVPVEQLVSAEQRFKCLPFSAVISASTCIDRQDAARAEVHGPGSRVANEKRAAARRFGRCADCKLGRSVAAQIRRVA